MTTLDRLPWAEQASFDSSSQQDNPTCFDDTRSEVLKQIKAWTYGDDKSCIFWLSGMVGTGKSTIARTISREFSSKNDLGASFFFVRDGGDVARASLFFTTIARQLAIAQPALRQYMSEAVRSQPDIATKSRADQWTKLILQPLAKLPTNRQRSVLVIVLDALEECDNNYDVEGIIAILGQAKDVASVKLRILVTSRPGNPTRFGFSMIPQGLYRELLLHDQPREIVDQDICLFLYSQFERVKRAKPWLSQDWPGVDAINFLVHLSAGLFIFAATVCGFISQEHSSAEDSLKLFFPANGSKPEIPYTDNTEAIRTSKTRSLDMVYSQILIGATRSVTSQAEQNDILYSLKEILGSIAALNEPLPVRALAGLLNIRESFIFQQLDQLHSVLRVPIQSEKPVSLLHDSFREFLFDGRRHIDPAFSIDRHKAHRELLRLSLRVLESALRPDLCHVRHPGTFRAEISKATIDGCIPLPVRYACLHWVHHVERSSQRLHDHGHVYDFLKRHFLHWLESLSWLGKASSCVAQITILRTLCEVSGNAISSQEALEH